MYWLEVGASGVEYVSGEELGVESPLDFESKTDPLYVFDGTIDGYDVAIVLSHGSDAVVETVELLLYGSIEIEASETEDTVGILTVVCTS